MDRLILVCLALFGVGLAVTGRPADRDGPGALVERPPRDTPVAAPMEHTPGEPMLVPGHAVELRRAANGHFHADVSVNGQSVEMLVDTGATVVALTVADARRLGISVDPATFAVVGTGASGPVRGAAVTLDSVALGARHVGPVAAVVLEGLDRSLLGQSFLSRLDQVRIEGDTMVLR